jgi:hypothetical protein
MPFYVAKADASGNRIVGSEIQLSPGPTRVDYPTETLFQSQETSGGSVIQQAPSRDPRRRAWVWAGYPGWMVAYQRLWATLESLRSTHRKAYGAPTPYVYLRDTETQELRRRVVLTGTATGGSANTLVTTGLTSGALVGFQLELVDGTGVGQVRTIIGNTTTTVTVDAPWSINPVSGTKFVARGDSNDWFKARVTDVVRTNRQDGGLVRYEETKLVFVLDADSTWNQF